MKTQSWAALGCPHETNALSPQPQLQQRLQPVAEIRLVGTTKSNKLLVSDLFFLQDNEDGVDEDADPFFKSSASSAFAKVGFTSSCAFLVEKTVDGKSQLAASPSRYSSAGKERIVRTTGA